MTSDSSQGVNYLRGSEASKTLDIFERMKQEPKIGKLGNYSLVRSERELHISLTEDSEFWMVDSSSPIWARRMTKLFGEPYKVEGGTAFWKVPTKQLTIHRKKKVVLSEERKAELAERLRNYHGNK